MNKGVGDSGRTIRSMFAVNLPEIPGHTSGAIAATLQRDLRGARAAFTVDWTVYRGRTV